MPGIPLRRQKRDLLRERGDKSGRSGRVTIAFRPQDIKELRQLIDAKLAQPAADGVMRGSSRVAQTAGFGSASENMERNLWTLKVLLAAHAIWCKGRALDVSRTAARRDTSRQRRSTPTTAITGSRKPAPALAGWGRNRLKDLGDA